MSSRNLRGAQPQGDNSSSASSTTSAKPKEPSNIPAKREISNIKSLTPQSSSDDAEPTEQRTRDTRQTRQQKREITGVDDANDKQDDEEDVQGDDAEGEVTRCVCGREDYPGPPVPLSDNGRNHSSRDSRRMPSLATAEGLPEDAGGLFISCDTCGVWQHGGCVGIMREELSPENYYCEKCRDDLHELLVGARGQRYSRYLPILEAKSTTKTPRRSSALKDSESRSSREADAKATANMSSAKRRSTMNSRRDLEEEEMLKKAIEESKSVDGTVATNNGQRRSKRGREEDGEEAREQIKRQKTRSGSGSPETDALLADGSSDAEEDKQRTRPAANGKGSRAPVAAQTQRERDLRDRERQKESERLEAAGRRSGRADRRRADESEPTDDPTRPTPPQRNAPATKTRPQLPSKQSSAAIPTTSTSHKKKPSTKKGRVGRNQYTKDRDLPSLKKASPRPPQSRGSEEAAGGNNNNHPNEASPPVPMTNGSKPSKPRHMNPNRTSMNDLRKRAAGILEYITRTQVELAEQSIPSGKEKSGSSTPSSRSRTAGMNGSSKLSTEVLNDLEDVKRLEDRLDADESTFTELSSVQMMDVLTRELVLWQKDFGKYGEKT